MQFSETKISFWGTPVSWDRSGRLVTLPFRHDFLAVGLTLAAAEVLRRTDISFNKHAALGTMLEIGLTTLPLLANIGDEYLQLRKRLSKKDLATKCIDTEPDKNSPPNNDKWGLTAMDMKFFYKGSVILTAVNGALFSGVTGVMGAGLIASAVGALTIPTIIHGIRGWYRWHNIETGKWRVSDKGPPPEPVRPLKAGPMLGAACAEHR
jgi:hypothetical protein